MSLARLPSQRSDRGIRGNAISVPEFLFVVLASRNRGNWILEKHSRFHTHTKARAKDGFAAPSD